MGDRNDDERPWSGDPDPNRTLVEDTTGRRPFMRGIMVHSLMARGIAFEQAYRTADRVRERIRGRSVVPKDELSKAVLEILGSQVGRSQAPTPLRSHPGWYPEC